MSWIILIALLIVVVCVLVIVPVRKLILSRFLLIFFRHVSPKMSATEQEALTAGGVGWEGEIFTGKPNFKALQELPENKLTAEEQAFLDGPVEELCGMINDWEINQVHFSIPQNIWDHLKKNGYFGLIIPKKYGGLEFSALAHAQIITKATSVSTAVAVVIGVPNSLGPAELLLHYGTEEQKNYYLPRLARGEEIPCFALTSHLAGSDAGAIEDEGVICKHTFNGEEKLAIRLNWNKRYITLAPITTVIGLAFKLYDPDHLLGDKENLGITCALIHADTPGVVKGNYHIPLKCAFPNGPTEGKNVIIPIDNIIGGRAKAGQGWRMLMECLAVGRSITLPSVTTGIAKSTVYAAGAYVRIREQFNTSIGLFGGVQDALARAGCFLYMAEALRLFTINAVDRGLKPSVASAISKYHTTEMVRHILNHLMDVHGGKAICMGPRNYIAQDYIEAPIAITVEGANILTRSMIIFGQGAIRCHPFVLKEIYAAANPDPTAALNEFDAAFFGHIKHYFKNLLRASLHGLTGAYFCAAPSGELKRYYQKFSRYSAILAFVGDTTMFTLGGRLKFEEKLSARLGDLLSMLYIGSACLKYYEWKKEAELLPFVKWSCDYLLYQMQQQLHEFLLNFPNRFVAFFMRAKVFPLGRCLKPPKDNLGTDVVKLLMRPSNARAIITDLAFTKNTPHNPIGLVSELLEKVIQVEPIEMKLHKAGKALKGKGKNYAEKIAAAQELGIISSTEAEQLLKVHQERFALIDVDAFSLEDLKKICVQN